MVEFTMSYLESLSTGELIDLATRYDLDIPPALDRMFIIEELLYIERESEDPRERHDDVNQIEFTELAILPKQYHVSFIDILIRDPLWAFAFWEIKAHDRGQYESTEGFMGYCLRVIPLDEEGPDAGKARKAAFIVTVDIDDGGRYLGFPPEDGRCFTVELCAQCDENYAVLAQSAPFRLPDLIIPRADAESAYSNPLAVLSGIENFSLIHSEDRLSRRMV